MNASSGKIDIQQEMSDQLTVHKSLDQEIIVTTADKIRLCLIENKECLRTKNEWILPLTLLITIVATLLATDFKEFLLSAAVWEAIFILGSIICVIWLLKSGRTAWKNRKLGGIEEIVTTLKHSTAAANVDTNNGQGGA